MASARDPDLSLFLDILQPLEAIDAPYMIIGAFAGAVYGADADEVVFTFLGDVELEIDPATGDAVVQTPLGTLRDRHHVDVAPGDGPEVAGRPPARRQARPRATCPETKTPPCRNTRLPGRPA